MSGDFIPQGASELTIGVHRFFGRIKTPLYAIVDTARDRKVMTLLEESNCHYEVLYPERFAHAMDYQGPHLVSVCLKSPGFKRLVDAGWGNRWGIYLAGPNDFAAVRRHLRRLLFVKLEEGHRYCSGSMIRDC